MKKYLNIITIIFVSNMLFSIANAGSDGSHKIETKSSSGEINDCFEKVNRGIFAFNQGLDKVIFKPLATGYRKLPQPVRSGASNALGNLGNVVTIPNNILQGQIKGAGVKVNTANKDAFIKASKGIYDQFASEVSTGGSLIKKVSSLAK